MPQAQRDLVIILALSVPVYVFLVWLDAFDLFFKYSRSHEDYQLDELVALVFFIGLAAIVFSARRINDLRKEMQERRAAESEAQRLARHDALTGLPNRRRFLEEFNSRVSNVGANERCAMFVLDLDYFKPINDLYGHRLGDEVLRVVAQRLSEIVEDQGMVARLGGDEFGIVMTVAEDDDDLTLRVARRIVHEIPRPINLASLSLDVGASVGISMYDKSHEGGEEAYRENSAVETVLRQADIPMYRAKTEGRGGYHYFDSKMDERLQQRVRLEREIKGALERGEIVPHYQALVDLHTRETVGYELLARWQHPTMGVIEPEVFIPIAEDTGAIGALTDVKRLEEAKVTLKSLRNLGVRIALDDFGTGYSGLHHLRELQLDTIKIDQSFVTDMLKDAEDEKLVEAIVSLGRVLGLRTTAEGIETKDVLDKLVALGCDTGQGFLFGRPEPMTAAAVTEELTRRSA
jgi:diguanylate cyclase (GGDEF)-like protein